MLSGRSGQDWKEVVLHKPTTTKGKGNVMGSTPHFEKSPLLKLEQETDLLRHATVPMSLAKTIQNARLAKFPSQKDFAKALNMRVDIVNSYESGKAVPDNAVLQKMRRILNVKLDPKNPLT